MSSTLILGEFTGIQQGGATKLSPLRKVPKTDILQEAPILSLPGVPLLGPAL